MSPHLADMSPLGVLPGNPPAALQLVTAATLKHREHVALDSASMRRLGLRPGQQARVSLLASDGVSVTSFSLCTVVEDVSAEASADSMDISGVVCVPAGACQPRPRVGISPAGLSRLLSAFSRDESMHGAGPPAELLVTPFCPIPGLSESEARALGEMTESVVGSLATARVLVLAPHGGDVEPGTEAQAEEIVRLLGHGVAVAWICRGYNRQGSAMGRHHVTSTELSEASFPGLARVSAAAAARPFEYAVSLHGMREAALAVRVGGGAPEETRREVADAVRGALRAWADAAGSNPGEAPAGSSGSSSGDDSARNEGSGEVDVQVVGKGHRLSGAGERNVVNRYSARGVQLEQGGAARAAAGPAVASALAGVISRRLAAAPASEPRSL